MVTYVVQQKVDVEQELEISATRGSIQITHHDPSDNESQIMILTILAMIL